jgi:hypothetical protein
MACLLERRRGANKLGLHLVVRETRRSTLRHDHKVAVVWKDISVSSEDFAEHSLYSVSTRCVRHLLGDGDPKTTGRLPGWVDEYKKMASVHASSAPLHSPEFATPLQPACLREGLRPTGYETLLPIRLHVK